MTNKNKRAGTGFEYRAVEMIQKHGLKARRQILSGAHKDHPGDLIIEEKIVGECKLQTLTVQKSGEKCLTIKMSWLVQVEKQAKDNKKDFGILIVKPKGTRRTLAVIDADILFDLLAKIYK